MRNFTLDYSPPVTFGSVGGHNFAARHVVVLGNVTKDRLGPCQGSNERKVMGSACGFVCSPKWSDLLQVKTKMFQYRGGLLAVYRTADFMEYVFGPSKSCSILSVL